MKLIQKYFTIYEIVMIVAFVALGTTWAIGNMLKGGIGLLLGGAILLGLTKYIRLAFLSWSEYKDDNNE